MRRPIARRSLFNDANDRGPLEDRATADVEEMLTFSKGTPRDHGPDRLIRPRGQLCQFSNGKIRLEDGRIHRWRAARRLASLSSVFG